MVEKILEIPTRASYSPEKFRGAVRTRALSAVGCYFFVGGSSTCLDQRRKLGGWKQTPSTHIHDVHMWTNTADKARARTTHKKITTYSRQGTCTYIRPKIFRRIGCARARAKNNITKISNHGEKKKSKPLGFELKIPGDKGNAQNPEPPGRGTI